jgi:biotin carboxyl carrier protein
MKGLRMSSTEVRTNVAGTVFEIHVSVGDTVDANDTVAVMESMKMEVTVVAPTAGTVQSILVQEGDSLDDGATILTLE